jgi:hypothetical protein
METQEIVLVVTRELLYRLGIERVPLVALHLHPALACAEGTIPPGAEVMSWTSPVLGDVFEIRLFHASFPTTPFGDRLPRWQAIAADELARPDVVVG